MNAHLGAELCAFAERFLPAPPARVLDVGCGDGATTRLLTEKGYSTLGLDPEAPDEPGFRRGRLEELDAGEEFDAAVAVRSLHHVHDLARAVDALADALPAGGRLVIFEFAIEAVDGAARRWCSEHDLWRPTSPESAPEVTPLAELRIALEVRFRPLADIPAAYHARESGRPEAEPDELRAIAAGQHPARRRAAGLRAGVSAVAVDRRVLR